MTRFVVQEVNFNKRHVEDSKKVYMVHNGLN